MRYLFGDSTESNLEFNYLAFLREVVDCAVVVVECDVALVGVDERKRAREREAEALLAEVADFGKRASDFVAPTAEDKKGTAVGRAAAAVANSIRQAIEWESTAIKTKLTTERDELSKDGGGLTTRAKESIEKLLRAHDLPEAEKQLEVTWTGTGVKATMRQRAKFGVEAVIGLDIPAGSLLAPDLRVDRVADGVEVHMREAGGWIKKSDKLVAHKLGRYHVTSVTIGASVMIQLRADNNAGDLTITSKPSGELTIFDNSGSTTPREVVIEERDQAGLTVLVEKLEAATRALSEARGNLVSIEIDGKSLAEHARPRVFAERLTTAIGPTVQTIKKRSRSPGELVLRRLIENNRREELFVSIDELVRKIAVLPVEARRVFAALHLQDNAEAEAQAPVAPAPTVEPVSAPVRKKEPTQPFGASDSKRPEPPIPPPPPISSPKPAAALVDDDEWPSIARVESGDKDTPSSAK